MFHHVRDFDFENKFEKKDNLKNQEINEMAVKDKPKILCIDKFSSM